jgi:hypothetical protein
VNDIFYIHLLNARVQGLRGTKEKLGGFNKMWNMLKKEAEKKPQDLIITIIDTEYMTRDSLKRAVTKKFVDDQLLNTFSAT